LSAVVLFGLVWLYWLATAYIPAILAAERARQKSLVFRIGFAYIQCVDWHGRVPSSPADIEGFLQGDDEALEALRRGDVIVRWNTSLEPASGDSIVIAYQATVPDRGRWVSIRGGEVRRMTAEEFHAALGD
jgi:hypothetical protein